MAQFAQFNYKALLVEDEIICARMIELYLDELGIMVDTVLTGQDAMTALSKNTYDVILIDIGLPDKSGMEVTKDIRRALGLDIPILGMTSHAFESAKKNCIEAGMLDVLFKPIFQETLSKTLRLHLKEFSE